MLEYIKRLANSQLRMLIVDTNNTRHEVTFISAGGDVVYVSSKGQQYGISLQQIVTVMPLVP